MLTISSPAAYSPVPSTSFNVSGTCNTDHEVTVTLTETSTNQYHTNRPRASQGAWSTTFYPWASGQFKVTAICDGMTDPIEVDNIMVEASATPGGGPGVPGAGS